MSEIELRHGKKPFYDNKKFPRGFAKSGDFTLAEEELLIQFGDTMSRLESGELKPENQVEQHFLEVLKNPLDAQSKIEKVWVKYTRLARGRKRFHTLNGRNKPETEDDYSDVVNIESESE
jgi:uncharacterized protein YifE (UPF0438 family)